MKENQFRNAKNIFKVTTLTTSLNNQSKRKNGNHLWKVGADYGLKMDTSASNTSG